MNKNFKSNERELVKVATFFKKQSQKLVAEGKLGEEHKKVGDAVDRFVEQMGQHADARAFILSQREELRRLVKDEAACPQCKKKDMLKRTGVEKNEKGWESNRYKCRRCNIAFTWNTPNNPWDMMAYIQDVVEKLQARLEDQTLSDAEKQALHSSIEAMYANLDKISPVIEAHEKEYGELQRREGEMERLIHEFKNSLLIEKIKMDTWENKTR